MLRPDVLSALGFLTGIMKGVVALAGTLHPAVEASLAAAKQKVCTQEAYPRVAYVHCPGLWRYLCCDGIPAHSSVTGHYGCPEACVTRI